MKEFYTLEYKTMDSKGREKNAKFVGVFMTFNDIEKAKKNILEKVKNNVFFQMYNHKKIFP